MSGLGPFDLDGPHFLALYAGLMLLAWLAGMAIPRWLRPEGASAPITAAEEIALLAGGAERHAEAVVAGLVGASQARIAQGRLVPVAGAAPATRAGRVLAHFGSGASWAEATAALAGEQEALAGRLEARGLLMSLRDAAEMRIWQTLPWLLLLPFGMIKWWIGHLRERPVGFLTLLLFVTAVAALVRWKLVDRRTRGGIAALASCRQGEARLRQGALRDESALAVALFGTAVLAGSPLADFHRWRTAASDGGSAGGGCGSGGGGGGCGGGGCGGCGS